MPSPSLIAREDEFAAAEVVDAEPVLDPPVASERDRIINALERHRRHPNVTMRDLVSISWALDFIRALPDAEAAEQ